MIRVYRYGLLAPIAGADDSRAQMRAGHDLQNDLISIERGRRAAVREATREVAPDLVELERAAREADDACADADRAIRAARAATRSRSDTEGMRSMLRDAREARTVARRTLAARRKEVRTNAALQAEIERINGLASDLGKSAYDPRRVYWGNRQLAVEAVELARKMPLYDGVEPSDPRFSRWDGSGYVAVMIQAQADKPPHLSGRLYGSDTRVRIDPVATWSKPNRHGEERRKLPLLHLRVRSTEGGDPVWASWPILVHREIPSGAVVKRVVVHCSRRGPREEWSVSITVDVPDSLKIGHGTGTVAINFGWRVVPDGVRVASWVGDDGEAGELMVNPRVLGGFAKVADLGSIRDQGFNAARAALVTWMSTQETVPSWLALRTSSIAQWRSPARLAALARSWRESRFAGDDEAYSALESWRYHDYHLWSWETSQRASSLRYRREVYRVFAAQLARRYGVVAVEDFDLTRVARRAPTEAERENETARSNRHAVAPSELRLAIKNAVVGRGGEYVKVPAAPYTHECHACGSVEAFDASTSIHQMCRACSAVWDQDRNAAVNILAACERSRGELDTAGARNGENHNDGAALRESKWAKVKRLRAEKCAASDTSRNTPDKVA